MFIPSVRHVLTFCFIVLGLGDIAWGAVLIQQAGATLFFVFGADSIVLIIIGVLSLTIGCFYTYFLREDVPSLDRKSKKPNASFIGLLSNKERTLISMVALISVLCLFFAVPSKEYNFEGLRKIMENEAKIKANHGLLVFSHHRFDCCGVTNETICIKDYPPFYALQNKTGVFSLCPEQSQLCSKGCLDALWVDLIMPYRFVSTVFAFASGVLSMLVGLIFMFAVYFGVDTPPEFLQYDHNYEAYMASSAAETSSGKGTLSTDDYFTESNEMTHSEHSQQSKPFH